MNSSEEFDQIASGIFFPIYAVIGGQALQIHGRNTGRCLDAGCGGGHLGLSVARASAMHVVLMDASEEAIAIAEQRSREWGLESRSQGLVGDVRRMQFPANSFDLIVSRGSIGFWGDRSQMLQAFSEIYRVLAPGGTTYIGKGMGSAALAADISAQMKVLHPEWPQSVRDATNGFKAGDYSDFLTVLGITADIIDDERGTWIMMKKPRPASPGEGSV